MKIKTEIINKIFVVTCQGNRFDASFAQEFVKFMRYHIQKGHLDIILDLSSVEFVDSSGLGAIVRCLKEINGRGKLVLCGVNEMVLSLLQITRLEKVFIRAADRKEAFKRLALEKKKQAAPPPPPLAPPKPKGFDDALLSSLSMEGDDEAAAEKTITDRRRYRRIDHKYILNEDIILKCINKKTGKRLMTVVIDISPGGVLIVSPSKLSIGEKVILEGRIGANFKFREQAVVRNCREGKYGLEFIDPLEKTKSFLLQLTGSVMMGIQ